MRTHVIVPVHLPSPQPSALFVAERGKTPARAGGTPAPRLGCLDPIRAAGCNTCAVNTTRLLLARITKKRKREAQQIDLLTKMP